MRHKTVKLRHPYRLAAKTDPVHPRDFRELNIAFCCEQCSHFNPEGSLCTLGYATKNHKREPNLKNYELTGRISFCRYMEID